MTQGRLTPNTLVQFTAQTSPDIVEALHYLVGFEEQRGDDKKAAERCSQLLQCGGSREEWAKGKLRELEEKL